MANDKKGFLKRLTAFGRYIREALEDNDLVGGIKENYGLLRIKASFMGLTPKEAEDQIKFKEAYEKYAREEEIKRMINNGQRPKL